MAWFSGSLGNFPDLAGAVNKFQESVKNIEKNFDSALGFEEKSNQPESSSEASGLWPPAVDRKALFDPVMAFMGSKHDENDDEMSKTMDSTQQPSKPEEKAVIDTERSSEHITAEQLTSERGKEPESGTDAGHQENVEGEETVVSDPKKSESDSPIRPAVSPESVDHPSKVVDRSDDRQLEDTQIIVLEEPRLGFSTEDVFGAEKVSAAQEVADPAFKDESHHSVKDHEMTDEQEAPAKESMEITSLADVVVPTDNSVVDGTKFSVSHSSPIEVDDAHEISIPAQSTLGWDAEKATESVSVEGTKQVDDSEADETQRSSSAENASGSAEIVLELEKTKAELKMLEKALQGAAKQAQAKADEIAKLMNENEQLKAAIERKSNEAELESLREEYHQRVASLERKVYALTKERDTLRREQNRKSDAAALLKEKDEIITQVMAEGEELSKKQAAQESQIRKLRAQIRELEEEKKGLMTKLQAEENKVESIKKDKTATEKLLQENTEKHQADLAAQKEYYTNALNAAKEAQALAEERANTEARTELESRLKEAEERESMLVQALEELRQTLSRKEQQAVFIEDMHRRDIEDLQRRYQASERRCEELITQVPESTRPLLRQIEAMQETTARRAEAWAAAERSLNSRLQEAEANAAAAEERERSVNERLSQTLSRINVLEAQISCLRAEQTQLSKSLEKERQRAAENRQEYLAAKEEANTHESRAKQFEEEIRELRRKHKQELQDALLHSELLQKDLEREKATRLDLERTARVSSTTVSDQAQISMQNSDFENGSLPRKLSSAGSLSSMEESYFLQASLDPADKFSEKRTASEASMSPYYMKSITPSAFEATLRQKEGELASYMSRLQSMESIRDSLAEELVKMTAQCEKLQAEASTLPGIKAELEALRRRHSAALELMGERDEELEELRADIIDLKEMYREQVNLLVNKIQIMSQTTG